MTCCVVTTISQAECIGVFCGAVISASRQRSSAPSSCIFIGLVPEEVKRG